MHEHHHHLDASTEASVMLEVGEGVGALVLHTAAERFGDEIELRHESGKLTHSAVRLRHVGATHLHAAVYPSLAEGCYEILENGQRVAIESARVVEVQLQ